MSKKILLIAPLFVPNDIGMDIQMKSLDSLIDSEYDFSQVDFAFGGYVKSDKHWEEIENKIWKWCGAKSVRFDSNVGKAVIVNGLFTHFWNKQDYIFTYDSDICFDKSEYRFFDRLLEVADSIPDLGLISLNQKEHCCHLYDYVSTKQVVRGEIIHTSPDGRGIAGGCLLINSIAFTTIGKYREMGVYDGDDGWLMIDMNECKKTSCIISTLSVIHPYSKEYKEGYVNWKVSRLQKCDGLPFHYKQKLEESEEYWNA